MDLIAARAQGKVDDAESTAVLGGEQRVLDLEFLHCFIRWRGLRQESWCHGELGRDSVVEHFLAEVGTPIDIFRPRDSTDTGSEKNEVLRLASAAGGGSCSRAAHLNGEIQDCPALENRADFGRGCLKSHTGSGDCDRIADGAHGKLDVERSDRRSENGDVLQDIFPESSLLRLQAVSAWLKSAHRVCSGGIR